MDEQISGKKEFGEFNDFKNGQYAYLKTLSSKSNAIYNFLLIALIVLIASLPFIKVQIAGHAFFVMQNKPSIETIYSPIAGRVIAVRIIENSVVNSRDTALVIDAAPALGNGPKMGDNSNGSVIAGKLPQGAVAVLSNVSGVATLLEGTQVGAYVQAGQKLAELLPDSNLTAICYLAPSDMAYLKPGQQIKLQMDAYNYYDWGMLAATVTEVKRNVAMIENQPFYAVHCKLEKSFLTRKNGYSGTIVKGMTGRASFEKGDKSLWQLLFTKASEWFNPNAN